MVDNEQLNHQRGCPEDLHIDRGDEVQGAEPAEGARKTGAAFAALGVVQKTEGTEVVQPHQRQQKGHNEAKQHGEGGEGDGADKSFQEHLPVFKGGFETFNGKQREFSFRFGALYLLYHCSKVPAGRTGTFRQ